VHFGGLCAVDHVSFDVAFGEIVAIIGPNGAGKTTLFNVISGIEQPSEGRLRLEDRDLGAMPIHERAAVIGRSFQVPRLVPELNALENVMARLDHLPTHYSEGARRKIAAAQLETFGLSGLSNRFVREIGLGYHKLIELARASVGQPPLLLLDEPAVGLTTDELERLAETLRRLREQNAAILIVEHNVDFLAAIADKVVVMESGRVIARGRPADVIADPVVQAAYFGALA
jgi:ABC-type branched-subunit amino acid transport system ATPase component